MSIPISFMWDCFVLERTWYTKVKQRRKAELAVDWEKGGGVGERVQVQHLL